MKLTYCLSSVVFFMYFSVVVLVTVNGQPTTGEDDSDKHELAELREELAKVRGELREVARDCKCKGKLAVTSASKQDASKYLLFDLFTLCLSVCIYM